MSRVSIRLGAALAAAALVLVLALPVASAPLAGGSPVLEAPAAAPSVWEDLWSYFVLRFGGYGAPAKAGAEIDPFG